MSTEVRSFNLWVLVRRSDEIQGVWRADIPALDYWAQGGSPSEAIDAAREVSEDMLQNELNAGRDPGALSPETWRDLFSDLVRLGTPIQLFEVDGRAHEIAALVVQFRVDCVHRRVSAPITAFETRHVEAA